MQQWGNTQYIYVSGIVQLLQSSVAMCQLGLLQRSWYDQGVRFQCRLQMLRHWTRQARHRGQ